jgi:hypothetical protein
MSLVEYSSSFIASTVLSRRLAGARVEVPVVVEEHRESLEALSRKAGNKLEDLLSARLDIVAGVLGMLILLAGASWVLLLALEKVESSLGGFLNPYSFLSPMLLFMAGIQIVIFALLANLLLQVRWEVSRG